MNHHHHQFELRRENGDDDDDMAPFQPFIRLLATTLVSILLLLYHSHWIPNYIANLPLFPSSLFSLPSSLSQNPNPNPNPNPCSQSSSLSSSFMESSVPPHHHHQHHHHHRNHLPNESNGNHHVSKKSKATFISDSDLRLEFSHHDLSIARINNGSFGSCPASVSAAQRHWQLQFLRQPDHFYFNRLQPAILRSRTLIKDLVNADHVDEISIVDNATTAAAIVLQQTAWAFVEGRFQKGDAVVMLHYAYGAVKKSIHAYVSRAGGQVIEVPLPFPVNSNEEIVGEFRRALTRGMADGRRVRLAVIDHITSMPSVVIPVKELVKICREEGVDQVFVDAAHAIGCTDVDMKEIGADFYTSNLHKWLFCPPSVAFLYCRRTMETSPELHHPVVSHEYGNGLAIESGWIGTRDYSAQLVVSDAIEFTNRFEGGIEGIKKRNHDGVVEMGKMLADAWGTTLGAPPEMCASLIMVGLPVSLGISCDSDALKLRTHLRVNFGVEVPIYYRQPKDGEVDPITGYARISYQVYNTVDDYYKFRDAINQLVRDGFTCTLLSN